MDDINAVIADFKEQKVQIGVYQRRIVELERALIAAMQALEDVESGREGGEYLCAPSETLRFLAKVLNGGGGK